MKNKHYEDEINDFLEGFLKACLMFCFLGGILSVQLLKKKPESARKIQDNLKLLGIFFLVSLVLGALSSFFWESWYLFFSLSFLSFWFFQAFLVLIVCKFFRFFEEEEKRLPLSLLKSFKKPSFDGFEKHFLDEKKVPLGMSLTQNKPLFLPMKQRTEHVIVSGATGMGKTTLMLSFLKHAFLHKHPLIVIDPKGDKADIDLIQKLFENCGRKKEDFKLFSLAKPKSSFSYNPLKNGTAEQLRSKIMCSLEFSHDYYKSQASQFIGTVLSLWKEEEEVPSFEKLKQALQANSLSQNRELSHSMLQDLKAIESIKTQDLAGLKAQIQTLTSPEFRNSSIHEEKEIDLLDVMKKNQIAYFQLNLNGYGFLGKKIGKILVQDLKVISSQIQSGQVDFKPLFLGVLIDEFGSFATPDFSDFLKQVRSAGIGVHLFCQGLADLNVVSQSFSNQVFGNTATKIILRQDVKEDCETWASTAGTMDTVGRSFQVSESHSGEVEKTGLGNLFETKKMKIEHDVFKNLKVGQAVLIDKIKTSQDLFQIFNLKE